MEFLQASWSELIRTANEYLWSRAKEQGKIITRYFCQVATPNGLELDGIVYESRVLKLKSYLVIPVNDYRLDKPSTIIAARNREKLGATATNLEPYQALGIQNMRNDSNFSCEAPGGRSPVEIIIYSRQDIALTPQELAAQLKDRSGLKIKPVRPPSI